MTNLLQYLSFIFLFINGNSAFAAELVYKWAAGQQYRFASTSIDEISISGMGMSVKDEFTLDSTFSILIERVNSNGTAEGVIVVESFRVVNKAGRVIGSISDLPKDALRNLVEIDRKGNFTFKEIIYMIVNEKGDNMLVSAKVGTNGVSGSAQSGDEKMTLHASFDPKTGQMSAGYSIEKIQQPSSTKKKVAVKQDATKVDILPGKFLELLKLPEGDIMPGESFSMSVANMTIKTKTSSISNDVASLETSITTGDGKNSGDRIGGNMGDMGGFGGMGGMDGMSMGDISGGMSTPQMFMNGSFESKFQVEKGMLHQIEGFLSTETKMNGISLKTTNKLTMKHLK